jgi:hypothetical protein
LSRFPRSDDQTVEFRGAAWLLASALETQTPGLAPVAHVATELIDRPVAARRLPFSKGEWRELYARVRRSVRESDGTRHEWPGVFVPSTRLLFEPQGRIEGDWLPKFRGNAAWVVQPRLVEFIPSALELVGRTIKPVVRDQPQDVITKAKAARLLNVAECTIYRWIRDEGLATYGPNNRVSMREVAALAHGNDPRGIALATKLSDLNS